MVGTERWEAKKTQGKRVMWIRTHAGKGEQIKTEEHQGHGSQAVSRPSGRAVCCVKVVLSYYFKNSNIFFLQ
jgi:hypothetical protein